jgi:hypothetical protein
MYCGWAAARRVVSFVVAKWCAFWKAPTTKRKPWIVQDEAAIFAEMARCRFF